MTTTDLQIHACSWSDGASELRAIRQQVFIDEQGVAEHEEWDQEDQRCTHFLVHSPLQTQAVACARLLADGHIGRVAVCADWRGKGIGLQLMRYILDYAAENGQLELLLDAQSHAVDFYTRLGFVAEGDLFMDAGIPHRRMRLHLADPRAPLTFTPPEGAFEIRKEPEPQPLTMRPPAFTLPPGGNLQHLDQLDALCQTLTQALASASRRCWIFSHRLDPKLYEHPDLIQALSAFARRNANTELRILLAESRPLIQRGHALARLRQRMPSLIQVRQADPDADLPGHDLILFDQHSWLELHQLAPVEACLYRNCPIEQQDIAERFELAWTQASESLELRSLKL